MTTHNPCHKRLVPAGSRTAKAIQAVQPFPEKGVLADKNLRLAPLVERLRQFQDRAYSYVVRSVKLDNSTMRFEQRGSAPNFQGDVLTLCTCKHQMRASQSPDEWENNLWLAGFTGRTLYDGTHWLFYLAKIKSAYESQSDLWKSMNGATRRAKAAHRHYLGDMFKPKKPNLTGMTRYSPSQYFTPSKHTHRRDRSDKEWHNDIKYYLADRYGYPPLLAADPRLTFIWEEPIICLKQKHCRNYRRWSSLQGVLAHLGEAR